MSPLVQHGTATLEYSICIINAFGVKLHPTRYVTSYEKIKSNHLAYEGQTLHKEFNIDYSCLICQTTFWHSDEFEASAGNCCISSAVYVLNDIKDLPRDKVHPKKKNRPLPSGRITIPEAYVILMVCIILAILPHAICRDWRSICYLMIYLIINFLYSNGLKNVPVIDVVILSSGYVLRILYGGAIANVEISS